ncbi:hypothetical protein NHX12_009064 [Muraenolepis orangiensis]|uniref:Extracellular calcium-sensing receptor n=1 Tax=Muraenolepis orangiensis TaxID=630683 RepID=A0A9Q0I8M4_9TELE|nr:hypothetical protein NHX12_009064 [Muraenolepis orangiensis]
MLLFLLGIMGAFGAEERDPLCHLLRSPEHPMLSKEGDITIGGVFSIHRQISSPLLSFTDTPKSLNCSRINFREFRFVQTMIFAIEEINNSTSLLPNVSLGYKVFDSCGSIMASMRVAMALLNGNVTTSGLSCSDKSSIHTVIGASESSSTIIMLRALGAFQIPVISHFATCACLSDKKEYPTFLRTIPSDYYQSRALAKLVKHFGWTWVGTVRSDNDYGNNGMVAFADAARLEGVCLEYSETISRQDTREKVARVVSVIRGGTARVLVAFLAQGEMDLLIEEAVRQNLTGLQWVGSESWITAGHLATERNTAILIGSLGFTIRKSKISGLKEFLLQVLKYLRGVNFTLKSGEKVYFDQNGDPAAMYELVNWQRNRAGEPMFVTVGNYDASLSNDKQFTMNGINITWAAETVERPQSLCSASCLPGFRQAMIKGKPACCFSCIPCAAGEISNATDSAECDKCLLEYWSNEDHSLCVPKCEERVCRLMEPPEEPQFLKNGDINLGGIFSFHSSWKNIESTYAHRPLPLQCIRTFQYAQAMLFAIEEINNSTDLLPGITLGYKIYDSCSSIAMSVRVALALMHVKEDTTTMSEKYCSGLVPGILGEGSSSPSMAIATVLGPFRIPLVSHFATCACLSNKVLYPSFLRTIPSDYYQSRALAQMVKHFGWTWVGAIRTNDDYGNNGMAIFTEVATQLGICLEYSVSFFRTDPPETIQRIIDIIKDSTSRVIVTFLSHIDWDILVMEFAHHNLTGYQWVGTETWISDFVTATIEGHHILDGSIGLSIPKAHVTGLREFLLDVKPLKSSGKKLFTEFWETAFNCTFNQTKETAGIQGECTGYENLTGLENSFNDMSLMPILNNVYKGVYAIAHSLHNILGCGKMCSRNYSEPDPFTILQNIKNINFKTKEGEHVYFNENGDPAAKYDIINWQPKKDGSVEFVTIGLYDATLPAHKQLNIGNKTLNWAKNSKKVPVSVCSGTCAVGSRKVLQKGKPVCCYDCIPCAEGEVSNTTDMLSTQRWPEQGLVLLQLLLVASFSKCEERVCRLMGQPEEPQLLKNGDIILGGIFSFHSSWKTIESTYAHRPLPLQCIRTFQYAQAMLFAIEEINNSTDLLPGITLGYTIYDACSSIAMSVRVALALMHVKEDTTTMSEKSCSGLVPAILGESSSSPSMAIATVLGPFRIPLVSHFATCACLSNKVLYPSFLRTIPSDYYQSRALAQMVKHFGWTWVGAIRSNDDYGNNGMAIFTEVATQLGICLEYSVSFFRTDPPETIQRIIDIIKDSTSRVIVTFLTHIDVDILIVEFAHHNLTGYQWVGTETWISDFVTATMEGHHILDGSIGLSIPKAHVTGLREFMLDVKPLKSYGKKLFTKFWETAFNCTFNQTKETAGIQGECTGYENLTGLENSFNDMSLMPILNNVYKGVYAIAHSLHNILGCGKMCSRNYSEPDPFTILQNIKNINFKTKEGEHVYFNENGDPAAKYDIINWQPKKDGSVEFVTIGLYDATLPAHKQLNIGNKTLNWANNSKKVPVSVCSGTCAVGSRKVLQKGKPVCCYDCIPCAEGEVSNTTGTMAVRVALSLINGNEDTASISEKPCSGLVPAIVGVTSSSPCMAISTVIGPFHTPLVSHFATCACLSNKVLYPSFIRTIPSDYYQSRALAQMVKHFGWTWVGAIRSNDDYGNNGMAIFTEVATQLGICLEYSLPFVRTDPPEQKKKIIETIKGSTSKVIIAFLNHMDLDELIDELAHHNLTGYQWVGTEGWISDSQIAIVKGHYILDGSIGLAIRKAHVTGLREFMLDVKPLNSSGNKLFTEFWETAFGCVFNHIKQTRENQKECTGYEDLTGIKNSFNDMSLMPIFNNVYKGVYAAAHTLHNILGCGKICSDIVALDQQAILQHLKNIRFTTKEGEEVYFNENGDPAAKYLCQSAVGHVLWELARSSRKESLYAAMTVYHVQRVKSATPQVSHYATCACLSNKVLYPSFLRTIPSDYYQSRALAQMVKHFGWTWVGAIRSNNDYGNNGMAIFTEVATQLGICLEYSLHFFRTDPPEQRKKIIETIKGSTSKVIIAFLSHMDLDELIDELAHHNLTGYQWVGTEAWISDSQTAIVKGHYILDGSIGLAIRKAHVTGMREFMLDVKPLNSSGNKLFTEFWETAFGCVFNHIKQTGENLKECTGYEDLTGIKNSFNDMSLMPIFNNVYKGVYAVAHTLHNILGCGKMCTNTIASDPLVISHFATCACLSNREEYPSFFRTIPSDYYQSRALAKLVKHFGWTWVGAISSSNDYGIDGMTTFIKAAQEEGVCIEYYEAFEQTGPIHKLAKIVEVIKHSTSKVIMAFMTHREIKVLAAELYKHNITGLQFVGSDAWITDHSLTDGEGHSILVGSIGFTVSRAQIPGLGKHLRDFHPSQFPDSQYVKDVWEYLFDCSLNNTPNMQQRPCSGSESLHHIESLFTDVSELRFTNNVYKSVYAVAHALNNLFECQEGMGPFSNGNCANTQHIEPWQLFLFSTVTSRNSRELLFARALIFAVEEINNNTSLLNGVTLGYRLYNGCGNQPPFNVRLFK